MEAALVAADWTTLYHDLMECFLSQTFLEPTCCSLPTYSSITGLSSWQTLQPAAAFHGCLMGLTAQQVLTVGCRPRRLPRQQPWMSVWLPLLTCVMNYSR